jgi:8-amino-7-oxononanoate synthase
MSGDLIPAAAEQLRSRGEKEPFRRRLALDRPQDVRFRSADMNIAFAAMIIWGLPSSSTHMTACEGARRYGVGAEASHLISGHSSVHCALEEALASFTGFPRALLF